jgi:hypothetical protein
MTGILHKRTEPNSGYPREGAADPPKSTIRLYRLFRAEWALKSIEDRELRVGRVLELNDPFEYHLGLDGVNPAVPHQIVDNALCFLRNEFHSWFGVLCFSERIAEPSIWGYYADGHKGIAMGFDFDRFDPCMERVRYTASRPRFNAARFDRMAEQEQFAWGKRVIATKALCWRYETERRVFVDLEKSCRKNENGNFFRRIPDGRLKQVCLGLSCETKEAEIAAKLKAAGLTGVEISRARRSPTHFRVLV